MTSEKDIWHYLFSGDLRRAAAGFESLRQDDASVNASAGLFLTFVFAGSDETAERILAERESNQHDLGLLLWRATWIGASNNLPKALDLLEAYLDRTDAPSSWRAPLFYGRGHIAAEAGDRVSAVAQFIAAGHAFSREPMLFLKNEDATLRSVVFQSMHMLTDADVHDLAEQQYHPSSNIVWIDHPGTRESEMPVIIAAADPHYIRLFGAAFANSLLTYHPDNQVHVHIVDGKPEDFDTLKKQLPAAQQGSISGSVSDTKRWPVHKPPVYASTRFLIAPALLDRFQRTVLLLDIDSTLLRPLDPLFDIANTNDFSCWVRPDGGPGGYTAAGAVAFSSGNGRAVASLTAGYIDRRLSEESRHLWFVDQAALFRAAHHTAITKNDTFKWGDFSTTGTFVDFFNHAPESTDKRR